MPQAIRQDVTDVTVGQAVVDDASDLAAGHDASVAQEPQLMRERRFAPTEQQREIANTELAGKAECVQQPRTRRVGEQFEYLGKRLGLALSDDASQQWPDVLRVEALHITAIRS